MNYFAFMQPQSSCVKFPDYVKQWKRLSAAFVQTGWGFVIVFVKITLMLKFEAENVWVSLRKKYWTRIFRCEVLFFFSKDFFYGFLFFVFVFHFPEFPTNFLFFLNFFRYKFPFSAFSIFPEKEKPKLIFLPIFTSWKYQRPIWGLHHVYFLKNID